eukprot:s1667_g1.t1
MKIKPPPPAYAAKAKQPEQPLGKLPGYAHQPKAEVPKAVESPKAKAPKSVPSPPVGPLPQKKAAVTGEPKAAPAAAPPAKILEQKPKTPPGVGQVECDGCGMIIDSTQAQRAKIAERRKAAIRGLGLRYDFRGDFLKQLTRDQLAGLGVTDPQDRGSSSPEAELLKRARGRLEKALNLGYTSVLDRFTMDTVFTETVLNEGENEYDCERYDMLAHCHLPKPDRDRVQIRLGNSQNSQLEHLSARLGLIAALRQDVESCKDQVAALRDCLQSNGVALQRFSSEV